MVPESQQHEPESLVPAARHWINDMDINGSLRFNKFMPGLVTRGDGSYSLGPRSKGTRRKNQSAVHIQKRFVALSESRPERALKVSGAEIPGKLEGPGPNGVVRLARSDRAQEGAEERLS